MSAAHSCRISFRERDNLQNFRMWFKYGLKAQKFQKQHALKGQKLLAQGIALGNYGRKPVAL